ncbi:MAG TPA: hypothetical protein VD968_18390 [Pyrinomonadaceae bacterium]|nr:hypothetical protein [Pyrinomonadaceae bacterium]
MADEKAPETPQGETPERDAEATSSETLADIEEAEKVPSGGSGSGSSSGGSLEGATPRPGSGSGEGRADGSDTGGPM